MRIASLRVVAALPLLLACASMRPAPRARAPEVAPTASSCAELAGSWEGTFPIRGQRADGSATEPDDITLRLTFVGDQARLFSVEQGTWTEVKPGRFAARCLGPSAVIDAIDGEEDSDGRWVEVWVLAVTLRDRSELLSRWVRVVNNIHLPTTKAHSKFSFEGLGVLRSVPTPEGCKARVVDGSMTIGDFLEGGCVCGDGGACAGLAAFLERAGGEANLARARTLRHKACDRGHRPSCPGGQ